MNYTLESLLRFVNLTTSGLLAGSLGFGAAWRDGSSPDPPEFIADTLAEAAEPTRQLPLLTC